MKGFHFTGFLAFGLIIMQLMLPDDRIAAQGDRPQLAISYENNRLSITAENADIKQVLAVLAEQTGLRFSYPASLERNVTIHRSGVSLRAGLRSLLRGLNHVIVYSALPENKTSISKVLIYSEKQAATISPARNRAIARIQTYENQIESLRTKIASEDPDSALGKQYARRLMLLERNLERLRNQSY